MATPILIKAIVFFKRLIGFAVAMARECNVLRSSTSHRSETSNTPLKLAMTFAMQKVRFIGDPSPE